MQKQPNSADKQKTKQFFVSGIAIYAFFYSFKRFIYYQSLKQKDKREMKKLNQIPSKRVSDVVQEAIDSKNNQSKLTFIEGTPVKGSLQSSTKIPLIMQVKEKSPLYSTDRITEQKCTLDWKKVQTNSNYQVDREPFFLLQEGGQKVQIYMNDDTNVDQALYHIGYKDSLRRLTFGESFISGLTILNISILKTLGPATLMTYFLRDTSFKGVHLGFRDNEFGIKAEGFLSVLGSVIYDTNKKIFKIENPLILTLSKKRNIVALENQMAEKQAMASFWLLLSGCLALYVARRIYLYDKQNPGYFKKLWLTIKSKLTKKQSIVLQKTDQLADQQAKNESVTIDLPDVAEKI